MKKISIISLSLLLAACSSGNYITEVTSDSYKEDYKQEAVVDVIATKKVTEVSVTEKAAPVMQENKAPAVQKPMTKPAPVSQSKKVRIIAPTQKQIEKHKRFGFTIQVIAVDSSKKAATLAKKLPQDHPVWENYKQVNGTEWFTLLYGDYETRGQAKSAIMTLPKMFRDLKPFVKSLDDVKNSPYPKLNKLR